MGRKLWGKEEMYGHQYKLDAVESRKIIREAKDMKTGRDKDTKKVVLKYVRHKGMLSNYY